MINPPVVSFYLQEKQEVLEQLKNRYLWKFSLRKDSLFCEQIYRVCLNFKAFAWCSIYMATEKHIWGGGGGAYLILQRQWYQSSIKN